MADKSSIEWTDATWNPVRGCDKISPGCKHCYAETFAERFRGVPHHPFEQGFDLRLVPEKLDTPLSWKKPRKIFVNSMSDFFHADIPVSFLRSVCDTMMKADWHTYQILTKRSERMRHMLLTPGFADVARADHIWWGVSVEDRKYGLPRVRDLQQSGVNHAFLSIEPLLEDLLAFSLVGIHWVIVGGESGPGARPCNVDWIRDIRDQCQDVQVPIFIKQLGGRPLAGIGSKRATEIDLKDRKGGNWNEWPEDLRVREFPA